MFWIPLRDKIRKAIGRSGYRLACVPCAIDADNANVAESIVRREMQRVVKRTGQLRWQAYLDEGVVGIVYFLSEEQKADPRYNDWISKGLVRIARRFPASQHCPIILSF